MCGLIIIAVVISVGIAGVLNSSGFIRQALTVMTSQPGDDGEGPVPTNAARFRLDVTLRVNGKVVTGSAVQQVAFNSAGGPNGLNNFTRFVTRFVGEALTMNCPGGRC